MSAGTMLVVTSEEDRSEDLAGILRRLAPDMPVRVWPETGNVTDIRYALAWNAPAGSLAAAPNLEAIFSTGAGVDHLVRRADLPDVPVVRFVDPNLTMRMTEYVCLHVLLHHRRVLDYMDLQRRGKWEELEPQPSASELRVGVMGLGVLGRDALEKLTMLGYRTAGWSRSGGDIPGVEIFSGADGLGLFLERTDILVALLPHTPETEGMLNRAVFAQLPHDGPLPGPVLVNAGRGKLQVEADILAALEAEELWACSLDVFEEEPLPSSSPLWSHPRIVITPHNASVSDHTAVCRYILRQIARHERGEPLENVVDPGRGY